MLFWILILSTLAYTMNITYDDLALKKCEFNQWSIHGFWPEYNKTNWPQFCNSSRYNEFQPKTILPILDLMNKYWYNCNSNNLMDNWSFWVHEWKKHGTCQPLSASEYFKNTINVFLEAQKNNWYGCCRTENLNNKLLECLIHINRSNYHWLGKCNN